jgi:hypothetical protein
MHYSFRRYSESATHSMKAQTLLERLDKRTITPYVLLKLR